MLTLFHIYEFIVSSNIGASSQNADKEYSTYTFQQGAG
jgi:hypothetical protein